MIYRNYLITITLIGGNGTKAYTAESEDKKTGWKTGCTELTREDAINSIKKAIDIFLDN